MALNSALISWTHFSNMGAETYSIYLALFTSVVISFLFLNHKSRVTLPLANPPSTWFFSSKDKANFFTGAQQILRKACQKFPSKCYTVMSDTGRFIIIPPQYAKDIRNDGRLSFSAFVDKVRRGLEPIWVHQYANEEKGADATSAWSRGLFAELGPSQTSRKSRSHQALEYGLASAYITYRVLIEA